MTQKELSMVVFIPLPKAYQCSNCDGITNISTQCPSCAGTVLRLLTSSIEPIVEYGNGGIQPTAKLVEQPPTPCIHGHANFCDICD